jgi:hypothetical protein
MRRLFWAAAPLALMFCDPSVARWDASYASQPPEVQAWFKQQHNSRGEWCCDESDGHRFFGDYTLNNDGSVTVQFSGAPHVIPAELVLKGPNPTGHAVWWYRDTISGHRDYCFAPGVLG